LGASKLSNGLVEKALGTRLTSRPWTVVSAIGDAIGEAPEETAA
jgi:hypothetical protein